MSRVDRQDPPSPLAPIPRAPSRRGVEPRSATLVRLAKLFASVDGAMAGGRHEELRGLLGRISLALTMAKAAGRTAPAELLNGVDADAGATFAGAGLPPRW